MVTSSSVIKFTEAFLSAQKKIGAALKTSSNPYFKNKYSDLNSVMDACKEHLNDSGITVTQPVVSEEHGNYVETILTHTSGEYISARMRLFTPKEDMQALGSAISYARRYSLQSMVFISSEDDDGEKATPKPNGVDTVKVPPAAFKKFGTTKESEGF